MAGDLVTEVLEDGAIRVCLRLHGFSSCTTVSSWHLVESKRRQLLEDITNQALAAYGPLDPS